MQPLNQNNRPILNSGIQYFKSRVMLKFILRKAACESSGGDSNDVNSSKP